MKRILLVFAVVLTLGTVGPGNLGAAATSPNSTLGINVVLNTPVTPAIVSELGLYGSVRDIVPEIRGVTLQAKAGKLLLIQKLPYVASASPDATRDGAPVPPVQGAVRAGRPV